MRPSRTQLVLVGIAVLGTAPRFLLGFQGFDVVESITLYFLIQTGITLLWYGLALGYAYRLGRDGRAGTPLTVARRYLVAGTVGLALVLITQSIVGPGIQFDQPVRTVAMLGSVAVELILPFVLAGLAGVPLGAMYGRDESSADGSPQLGEDESAPVESEQASSSDV